MLKQTGLILSVILVLGQAVGAQMTTEFALDEAKRDGAVEVSDAVSAGQASSVFTYNQGQWDEQVLYRVDNGDATTWLTSDGLYHQFTRGNVTDADSAGAPPAHNCRTTDIVVEKIRYCHNNPVRRGLVSKPDDWPWSSYRWYHGAREGEFEIDGVEL